MNKSLLVVEELERERQEKDRTHMAQIYDLREKLDFATSAKRRCAPFVFFFDCFLDSVVLLGLQFAELRQLCQNHIQQRV